MFSNPVFPNRIFRLTGDRLVNFSLPLFPNKNHCGFYIMWCVLCGFHIIDVWNHINWRSCLKLPRRLLFSNTDSQKRGHALLLNIMAKSLSLHTANI